MSTQTYTTAVTGLVKGKVQGVFFRSQAKEKARSLKLTGWVRNTDDGAVEILIAGNKFGVEFMKVWLQSGPNQASVESVNLKVCEDPGLTEFEILD